jgi:hypothetical protein
MAPTWEYAIWAGHVVVGVAVLRFLFRALFGLLAASARNDRRSRRSLEVLRLARRDATQIPSYLPAASNAEPENRLDS